MGGKAFPSLPTPRLPTPLYHALVAHFDTILRRSFELVGTPIPGPGKGDHGDVDVVVAGARGVDGGRGHGGNKEGEGGLEGLGEVLGATAEIKSGEGRSFAVPIPMALWGLGGEGWGGDGVGDATSTTHPHVQLDILHTPPELHPWLLFHHSHSDFWNLLGTTIRPFGLTATSTGLHIRIRAIEYLDRKRSRVLLTTDPGEALRFLGYGDKGEVEAVLEREFGSEEEMFWFVGRGRFFRREFFHFGGSGEGEGDGDVEAKAEGEGDERSAKRVKPKANDRKRMLQREAYRRFVCEWLPAQPLGSFPTDEGSGMENADEFSRLTREMVLEEALERFGKKEEYEARVREWERERRELERKHAGREERKREAEELEVYMGCWREWLSGNEDAAAAAAAAAKKEGLGGK